MILVLSPAKTLDESPMKMPRMATRPVHEQESAALAAKLKAMGAARIGKLMGISPELAALNQQRFQNWETAALKPAIRAFNGEAFRGLDARTLGIDDLRFAQRHLRVLSGMYGVLRPLDLIAPHRLEMGTRLAMGRGIKDLYAFWGDKITEALHAALHNHVERVLVNLASQEYFKSVRASELGARVITPVFKEAGPAGPRMVAVYAKHQRGAMARWIIRNRVLASALIKQYNEYGYRYSAEGSTANEWLFIRGTTARRAR